MKSTLSHFLGATFIFSFTAISFSTLPNASSSTFAPLPFSDSVRNAPVIVRGIVGSGHADWGKDDSGNSRIYTYYELQNKEILKGDAGGANLAIRELGGEKDGVGLQIPGTAQFSKGEDIVVFLRPKNKEGVFGVYGMMMGRFNIVTDENGVEHLKGPGLNQESWTLDSLRQLIQTQGSNAPPPVAPSPSPRRSVLSVSSSRPEAIASSPSPAPQLQNPPEKPFPYKEVLFWAGLGILIALSLLVLLLRRQK